MPVAAVQDDTYLPTTSKGCLGNWRLLSWPALLAGGQHQGDLQALLLWGMGIRALPSPLRARCRLPFRDRLLETAVLLLTSVSSLLCSPASVSECLRPSLTSWAACDSGPHFSSWNKA